MEFKTATPEDMVNVGKKIASLLKGGDIILLYGELGAGKSTLVKGIAEVLGVKETANSPTFTLMNIYDAKKDKIKKLIHVDTYRLKSQEDLKDLGIDEYINDENSVCIFEWPDKLGSLMEKINPIKITIEYLNKEKRKVNIEGIGEGSNISFKK